MEYEFVAGARSADCKNFAIYSLLCKHALPVFGIADKVALLVLDKPFGNRQNGDVCGDNRQNVLAEPVHSERAYAADDERRAFDCLSYFFYLIVLYSLGKVVLEFGMTVGFATSVDDFSVQRSAYEAHFVSVFASGKSESGAHHSRADNSNYTHNIINSLWIYFQFFS